MIKIKNLTKIYKSKKSTDCVALDNININLPDTGMVFVIGKSGSGKSTLLNLIGGLDTITSGSINIDGNEVGNMKSKDFDAYRSSYLTFVFQDYRLLENLSVYQNIEVGLDINNSVDHDVIKKSLKKVGLEGYEKRYPYELSGGQQQRVAIARALARDSKLILADEPTGNLDFNTSRQILAILKEVSKEKLVIIVSHNLMDTDIYADRIIELYDGKILSDKVKRGNYYNSFKIEEDKIILPHYYDLNNVQKDKMLEAIKSNNVKEVIQNDNGFSDYEYIDEQDKNIEFASKKAKNRSLFKIFKMFLKKRIHNRLIMIVFSILLFTVLSVLQSFIMYEPTMNNVETDDKFYVLQKCDSMPLEDTLRSGKIYSIDDKELDGFKNIDSNAKFYKVNNYHIPVTRNAQALHMLTSPLYYYMNYYTVSTIGTLVCDEEFVADNFFDSGKVEVICGDLYDKPYGVVITDYVADSILNYKKYGSYEDLLGYYIHSNHKYAYINAIIKTDYKEKYGQLTTLFDGIEEEESFYKLYNENKLVQDFVDDCDKKYNIGYSFNPNFKEEALKADLYKGTYLGNAEFVSGEYKFNSLDTYSGIAVYDENAMNKKVEVERGQIIMSYTFYNKLFGTMYSSTNYDLSVNNTVTLKLNNYIDGKKVTVYSKEFEIIKIDGYTYFDSEDYYEIDSHQKADYLLYVQNTDKAKDIINYGNNHSFYLKTSDFESGLVINKMTSTFNVLFTAILVCIYGVFGMYIIIYGINTVKANKEEIGIYKALGGKFGNIAKVLFIDVMLTGLTISVLSLIFTPFIIRVCDGIIVDSFKNVLKLGAVNIEIIKIYPKILALNYSLLNLLILISAIVPTILLIRLKPIEIIKN